MNDKEMFMKLVQAFGLRTSSFFSDSTPEMICDKALKAGAREAVNLVNVDFVFDKNGKFIGYYTDAADSWVKRKRK